MSILIPLLLAASQPAPAASEPVPPPGAPDWRPLGTMQGRFKLFYDVRRIDRAGDLVTIWIRPEPVSARERAPRALLRVEIGCMARTGRVVEAISRGADGWIAPPGHVPPPFDSIPAARFAETAHRAIC